MPDFPLQEYRCCRPGEHEGWGYKDSDLRQFRQQMYPGVFGTPAKTATGGTDPQKEPDLNELLVEA